jgi:protein Hikeshi
MNLPFAVLIPGQPVLTNFEFTNGIYHIDLPNPKTVANISIFLTQALPENYAITLNFSLPPYNEMQYLGAVANEKPSDTYSTGFPFKTEFDHVSTVKLCLQAQAFEEIANLVPCSDGQKEYSKLVAHNLYNFMMSYHNSEMLVNNNNGREYLVLPSDVFTRWMKKFDEKYAKDPNFIQKTTIE